MTKPQRGDILYFALSGLEIMIMIRHLGRCPGLLHNAPSGLFQNALVILNCVVLAAILRVDLALKSINHIAKEILYESTP
jgi:hypothetical protein